MVFHPPPPRLQTRPPCRPWRWAHVVAIQQGKGVRSCRRAIWWGKGARYVTAPTHCTTTYPPHRLPCRIYPLHFQCRVPWHWQHIHGRTWPGTACNCEQTPMQSRRCRLAGALILANGHLHVNWRPGCISEVYCPICHPFRHYPDCGYHWPLGFYVPPILTRVNPYLWTVWVRVLAGTGTGQDFLPGGYPGHSLLTLACLKALKSQNFITFINVYRLL